MAWDDNATIHGANITGTEWNDLVTYIKTLEVNTVWINATNQAPGDLTLSDATNWKKQYSFISSIKVVTASTDWDMWLCETSAFDIGLITSRKIASNRSGDFDITIQREYNSDSNNVYLIYTDHSGTNNANILIVGEARKH